MSRNPPVRTGLTIKEALEGGPLAIADMHRIYKDKMTAVNALRSKRDRIRPATYWSFARQCQFARALGFIEKESETPVSEVPQGDRLLAIRDGKVVPSTVIIYRLTAAGLAEQDAWGNLQGAARKHFGWK